MARALGAAAKSRREPSPLPSHGFHSTAPDASTVSQRPSVPGKEEATTGFAPPRQPSKARPGRVSTTASPDVVRARNHRPVSSNARDSRRPMPGQPRAQARPEAQSHNTTPPSAAPVASPSPSGENAMAGPTAPGRRWPTPFSVLPSRSSMPSARATARTIPAGCHWADATGPFIEASAMGAPSGIETNRSVPPSQRASRRPSGEGRGGSAGVPRVVPGNQRAPSGATPGNSQS